MCGIAGIYGEPSPENLDKMRMLLRRRGPDGLGAHFAPGVSLGHTRLAIIDPQGGRQPLCNEDQSLWVVANGEIYNHRQLRAGLSGHQFRTRSDSEVLLHLYEEEGPEMVRRLDGMFAFALWDGRRGRILLARDPHGIKPLYWGKDSAGHLLFASEAKALLAAGVDAEEFPPGHYFVSGQGMVNYWKLPPFQGGIADEKEALTLLKSTLEAAVEKRLMADVPLGCFLSGGLDSSLIAAIAARMQPGLHTFAIGLKGSADLLWARKVARHIGSHHHERALSPAEVTGELDQIIYALESFDPALVRSAVPTYFVSRFAARWVKVVLSGEGADELFAGYHWLKDSPDLSRELWEITADLHFTNLQRVDRMTMAHGLEGRVPFLDVKVTELAARIDPGLKLRNGIEKWILRRLAQEYLPGPAAWRTKAKFATGTGIADLMQAFTGGDEEGYYRKIFHSHYPQAAAAMVGRSRSLGEDERVDLATSLAP